MIFVIDDDEIMAECIARACDSVKTKIFSNGILAMQALDCDELPQLIFLDILLDGPDGFTFLNELISYTDTTKIPIVVVSSLDFRNTDLSAYNVVKVLSKDSMYPEQIRELVEEYCSRSDAGGKDA